MFNILPGGPIFLFALHFTRLLLSYIQQKSVITAELFHPQLT